jgi:nucleoside phosphorylase
VDKIDDLLAQISERASNRSTRDQKKAGLILPANNAATLTAGTSPVFADVAILVALRDPELKQVIDASNIAWAPVGREGIVFNVGRAKFGDQEVTVATAAQTTMGMVSAAVLATKTIRAWRPKLLAMTGICAGVKGKVNLGDIIVAQQVFDYGSGKLQNDTLIPDYDPVAMDNELRNYAQHLANDSRALRSIKDAWQSSVGKPDHELKAFVGKFASGAAVVADERRVKDIQQHMRSLLGIDMEAYGVARAAQLANFPTVPFLIVKGVQDFADDFKDDRYREYAAFVSAGYLFHLLERYWAELGRRSRA